jgi:hypothetical protein
MRFTLKIFHGLTKEKGATTMTAPTQKEAPFLTRTNNLIIISDNLSTG